MKRRPTLRTTTASNQGVCVVEFIAGRGGYVWIGEGTRAIGFCGLKALKRFGDEVNFDCEPARTSPTPPTPSAAVQEARSNLWSEIDSGVTAGERFDSDNRRDIDAALDALVAAAVAQGKAETLREVRKKVMGLEIRDGWDGAHYSGKHKLWNEALLDVLAALDALQEGK